MNELQRPVTAEQAKQEMEEAALWALKIVTYLAMKGNGQFAVDNAELNHLLSGTQTGLLIGVVNGLLIVRVEKHQPYDGKTLQMSPVEIPASSGS